MTRTRCVAFAFLLVAFSVPWLNSAAADDKGGKAGAKLRVQLPQNWGKIGLEESQRQRIYRIRGDAQVKIDVLEKQIEEIKTQEKKDMEAVLTAAQKARLREILAGKAPSE
jgi:hypothetical protein